MPKTNYNFLNVAKTMPRLRHKVGDKFDVNTSEVVKWLVSQPEIKSKIFNMAQSRQLIVYDPNTGEWRGADVP